MSCLLYQIAENRALILAEDLWFPASFIKARAVSLFGHCGKLELMWAG